MKTGFLQFAQEASEGFSLIAARAPLDDVVRSMEGRGAEVTTRDVQIRTLPDGVAGISLQGSVGPQRGFGVQLGGYPWTLVFRTIHWMDEGALSWLKANGAATAAELQCDVITLAEWSLTVHSAGKVRRASSTEKVMAEIDRAQIWIPRAFMGEESGKPLGLYLETDALPGARAHAVTLP